MCLAVARGNGKPLSRNGERMRERQREQLGKKTDDLNKQRNKNRSDFLLVAVKSLSRVFALCFWFLADHNKQASLVPHGTDEKLT